MVAPTTYPTGANLISPVSGLVEIAGGPQRAQFLATSGTFVLNGATPVAVAQTALTANSQILITLKTVGGTVGAIPAPQTVTPGTGFTVAGTAGDTSTYLYTILG